MTPIITLISLLNGCANTTSTDSLAKKILSADEPNNTSITDESNDTSITYDVSDQDLERKREGLVIGGGDEPYVPHQVSVPNYQILSAYDEPWESSSYRQAYVRVGNVMYNITNFNPESGFLSKETPLEKMLLCVSRDTIDYPYDRPFGPDYKVFAEEHLVSECCAVSAGKNISCVGVFREQEFDIAVAIYRDILNKDIKFDIPNPL